MASPFINMFAENVHTTPARPSQGRTSSTIEFLSFFVCCREILCTACVYRCHCHLIYGTVIHRTRWKREKISLLSLSHWVRTDIKRVLSTKEVIELSRGDISSRGRLQNAVSTPDNSPEDKLSVYAREIYTRAIPPPTCSVKDAKFPKKVVVFAPYME